MRLFKDYFIPAINRDMTVPAQPVIWRHISWERVKMDAQK